MDKVLQAKLEQFEKERDWSGMSPEDLAEVTEYTLRTLYAYLEEIGARNEASIIESALNLVETHLADE